MLKSKMPPLKLLDFMGSFSSSPGRPFRARFPLIHAPCYSQPPVTHLLKAKPLNTPSSRGCSNGKRAATSLHKTITDLPHVTHTNNTGSAHDSNF